MLGVLSCYTGCPRKRLSSGIPLQVAVSNNVDIFGDSEGKSANISHNFLGLNALF